jgi:hypothetical protein
MGRGAVIVGKQMKKLWLFSGPMSEKRMPTPTLPVEI